jgi:GDP-L-fucose synthase
MFLGSSFIHLKFARQPIKEEYLLLGELKPTNRAYALANIAGIEMCWSCNRQYGTKYIAAMPMNLYGPGDNYHGENSHVIPALIKRFHAAKLASANEVVVWGSGKPRREFRYSDDMADACTLVMSLPNERFDSLLVCTHTGTKSALPPLLNVGVGSDMTIYEFAHTISKIVGFTIAVGRKNYLFAGSDEGGKRAAAIYGLMGAAKNYGIGPEAYLK